MYFSISLRFFHIFSPWMKDRDSVSGGVFEKTFNRLFLFKKFLCHSRLLHAAEFFRCFYLIRTTQISNASHNIFFLSPFAPFLQKGGKRWSEKRRFSSFFSICRKIFQGCGRTSVCSVPLEGGAIYTPHSNRRSEILDGSAFFANVSATRMALFTALGEDAP